MYSITQLKYCKRIAGTNNNVTTTLQTVTVKKEPEDISSTSEQAQAQQIQMQQSQTQTIAVSVAPNQTATHTIVETASNAGGNQPQHIMTQHDNSDGSTSLQIAQVQNLPTTHQLTLSNLNQVNFNKKQKKNNQLQLHLHCYQLFDNLEYYLFAISVEQKSHCTEEGDFRKREQHKYVILHPRLNGEQATRAREYP